MRKNKLKRKKQKFEIRNIFYKKLLYIGFCLIPILLFGDNEDSFRLILLPFFLFGSYQLMQIIAFSQLIIDDFFPPKAHYEKNTKPLDKFIYYFSSILLFAGLISLIFEVRKFDNTINGIKLFWIAGLVGVLIAILLTTILKTRFSSVYYDSKRRYTVHFSMFVGLFLLSTAVTGFVNHHFADHTIFCKKYSIIRKSTSSSRTTEYYFFLLMENNKEERFSVDKTLFNNFEENEQIELCMRKGRFGFDYVTEFKKVNTNR